MEVLGDNALPKPTGLLELEEQAALQEAAGRPVELAVELDTLSRERVCTHALDKLLEQRKRAQTELEEAGSGSLQEAGAQLDKAVTERKLAVVAGVAGEVIVHEATKVLKRAA